MDTISQEKSKTDLEKILEIRLADLEDNERELWMSGFQTAFIELKVHLSSIISKIDDPEVLREINSFWQVIRKMEKESNS